MLGDAGLLDHRRPFGNVAFHALGHRFGRAAAHLHAELARLVLDVGRGQHVVDRPGKGLDRRLGRRRGNRNPVPARDFIVVDAAFPHGRHVGQVGRPLRAGGGKRNDSGITLNPKRPPRIYAIVPSRHRN